MQATRSHTRGLRRPLRRRRGALGLSLVEVTIVLLVMAIAGALAIPMLGGTASTKLRSAARLLAADLDHARIESITHADAPRVVVFDESENTYHLALATEPDDPLTDPTTGHKHLTRFGFGRAHTLSDVSIAGHNLDDDMLHFGIYGQLERTDPATITLTAGGREITLTVDPDNGEVTIGAIE